MVLTRVLIGTLNAGLIWKTPSCEDRVTSHYLLSSRWPEFLSAHHFDVETSSLCLTSALQLQLSWKRYYSHRMRRHPTTLVCAPHCRELLDGGLADVCCIRSRVTDCTSSLLHHHRHHHLPFFPAPRSCPHMLRCLYFPHWKDLKCCGLDKQSRLGTLYHCIMFRCVL